MFVIIDFNGKLINKRFKCTIGIGWWLKFEFELCFHNSLVFGVIVCPPQVCPKTDTQGLFLLKVD